MTKLPQIIAFNDGDRHGDYHGFALAEDGTLLAQHTSSTEQYLQQDLGVIDVPGPGQRNIEAYRAYYPDGYRIRFVHLRDVPNDLALQRMIAMNKVKRDE